MQSESSFNAQLVLARLGAHGLILQTVLRAMVRQGLLDHRQFDALEQEALAVASEFQATGDSTLQVSGARLEDELRGIFAAVSKRGQDL